MYPLAVEIQENISLAQYTTFGIGGPARYFCAVTSEADLTDALEWACERGLRHFVLGGGSNLLVSDTGYDGLVLHMRIAGVTVEKHGDKAIYTAGAGEDWDALVKRAAEDGCAGIECLAGIPGTVGGTPVQNVGAYGQEVAETIISVRVWDTATSEFRELDAAACGFSYRHSIFNTTAVGRYIVTRVSYALRPGGGAQLKYADLQKRFAGTAVLITLVGVYEAVRAIRAAKGMLLVEGDADCNSAGSFFKNPVVSAGDVAFIAAEAGVMPEAMPQYPAGEGRVKLSAAWLLERAGFAKGFTSGRAGVSTKHTLALTNRGGATAAEVHALRDEILRTVEQRFHIRLQQEPVELT